MDLQQAVHEVDFSGNLLKWYKSSKLNYSVRVLCGPSRNRSLVQYRQDNSDY